MKIVFSTGSLECGGAERVISLLSNYFIDEGHTVYILVYYKTKVHYVFNTKVKIVFDEDYIKNKSVFAHIKWRRRWLIKNKPDVCISFLAVFNIINLLASFGTKIPVIVADRNDPRKVPTNGIFRFIRNFSYRFLAKKVVVQTINNKLYFSKGIQKKCCVIYNPVDVQEYCGTGMSATKEDSIIYVGRLIPQKNVKLLLDAFRIIHQINPNVILKLYGEGYLQTSLEQYALQLNISKNVKFMGKSSNVFEAIQKAKLFVLPSKYEGMPNALLEAMCIGLPVISTKVSGATDFISDGINGMLVEHDDPKMLADAIQTVLASDECRYSLAKEAIKIVSKLNVTSISKEWIELISSTVI